MTDIPAMLDEFEAALRELAEFGHRLRAAVDAAQAPVLAVSRFSERDQLVVDCFRRFYGEKSMRDGAAVMATDLNRYVATTWLRERIATECPRANLPQGAFWLILRAVPRSLSASRIRRIVAQVDVRQLPAPD